MAMNMFSIVIEYLHTLDILHIYIYPPTLLAGNLSGGVGIFCTLFRVAGLYVKVN